MSGKRNSTEKNWWAPVWKGLVMDRDAAHFKKMGCALWLYLYLIVNANRSTGQLMRKVRTISSGMGIPRRTILRWLETLRKEGYIHTSTTGRFLTIGINKWKPLREVPGMAHQRCQIRHSRGAKSGTSQMPQGDRIMAPLKEESEPNLAPKKNTIKENILKRRYIDFKNLVFLAFKTREEVLAHDLAEAMDDLPGFPLYLTLARKYPESMLRETLGRVREIPTAQIKTSRGALFNSLIQKHGK